MSVDVLCRRTGVFSANFDARILSDELYMYRLFKDTMSPTFKIDSVDVYIARVGLCARMFLHTRGRKTLPKLPGARNSICIHAFAMHIRARALKTPETKLSACSRHRLSHLFSLNRRKLFYTPQLTHIEWAFLSHI